MTIEAVDESADREEQVKEANRLISEKLEQINALFKECADLATKYSLEFSFGGPGDTYGMGGWFTSGEWQASSQSC